MRIQDILDSLEKARTSLVIQWVRIHLPMKGTQVQSLVWKDFICQGATKAYVLQVPQSPPPITPKQRIIRPKMLIVSRLKNSDVVSRLQGT